MSRNEKKKHILKKKYFQMIPSASELLSCFSYLGTGQECLFFSHIAHGVI